MKIFETNDERVVELEVKGWNELLLDKLQIFGI